MRTTKIFRNGNSMAVRLPADFELSPGEITITREPGAIVLRVAPRNPVDLPAILAGSNLGFVVGLPSDPPPFDVRRR